MSIYKQDILNYGEDVNDLENSPFESLRMLHDRTKIQMVLEELDFDEKVLLGRYDLKLIENANRMVEHISNVYDFELSDENNIPHEQWWWHLDKIARGNLNFGVSSELGKVM
ncbi:hypothetical protein BKP35_16880 [Anaerobacillus arseniciselenatis]|uniref:Uncharacterized protein n=1 Tax=Anaerobacillus arseniciselenatis TaxID=85682 RepID=A0A1S2LBC5_9BACI|nr:hypothetical protein [Anaerobacillus arseniciselenatis]OIJ09343.1 hypothetical protein BKP35_16880 [Anaerobacillus arseniciselenatis]